MRYFSIKRSGFFLFVLAMVVGALTACGGGGGETTPVVTPASDPVIPVVAPAPAPVILSGITYTAFTEDRVSPASLTFDATNSIALDSGITYTLSATANGGCTFNSNPPDPDAPACSQLPSGEAFLLCNGTTGESFDTVLFKPTVVDASINDLRGLTMSALTCGSPAFRTTTAAINFSVTGVSVETRGGSTWTLASEIVAQFASPTGNRDFSFQRRFVVRKLVQSVKTTYFLVDLYENIAGTAEVSSPRIYVVEVNN